MYLCHFITSVDSTEPFCFSESRFPFVDISTLFQKGDSILILIPHDNGRSRTAQGETPLLPAVVGPHNIRRQHFLMLGWVLLCDYCSSFCDLPKTSEFGRAINAHIIIVLITATIAYYSEYVRLQNCLLPSSFPPPRALQLSTTTLPSSFCQSYITRAWDMPASFVHSCILVHTRLSVDRDTGSFFLQRTVPKGPTLAFLYNHSLSRRNIDGFRLYVCS
jgi:hypothetical protein